MAKNPNDIESSTQHLGEHTSHAQRFAHAITQETQAHTCMQNDNEKEKETFRKLCDERTQENFILGEIASKQGF